MRTTFVLISLAFGVAACSEKSRSESVIRVEPVRDMVKQPVRDMSMSYEERVANLFDYATAPKEAAGLRLTGFTIVTRGHVSKIQFIAAPGIGADPRYPSRRVYELGGDRSRPWIYRKNGVLVVTGFVKYYIGNWRDFNPGVHRPNDDRAWDIRWADLYFK